MSNTGKGTPRGNSPTPTVAAVSVKLPPFYTQDGMAAIWFATAESMFVTSGVTQSLTKYRYVVASLGPETAFLVSDLLQTVPGKDPYETLKKELVERTSQSASKRLEQLLSEMDLGDHKPSIFVHHMRSKAQGQNLSDDLLKNLFLKRMPPMVKSILLSDDTLSLEQMAKVADRLIEEVPYSYQVTSTVAATKSSHNHSQSDVSAKLIAEIRRLHKRIDALERPHYSRGRGRSVSSDRKRYRSKCRTK